jgi:hypothetical protein
MGGFSAFSSASFPARTRCTINKNQKVFILFTSEKNSSFVRQPNGTYYWEHKKWDIKFLSVLKNSIPVDSLKIYFILLFSFSKCPLLLIKVDFDSDFA